MAYIQAEAYSHACRMATDICVRIGRRIRVLRTERGWTQAMLADHAEITREHLSELESGKKEMGVRTLERIAGALEVAPVDLLG
jgi:transcriptional regulator with XRE-family HTH domain